MKSVLWERQFRGNPKCENLEKYKWVLMDMGDVSDKYRVIKACTPDKNTWISYTGNLILKTDKWLSSLENVAIVDTGLNLIGVTGKEDILSKLVEESLRVDNFDIFSDRALSLLNRWKKYHDSNLDKPDIADYCIKGMLQEITDDYTKALIERN